MCCRVLVANGGEIAVRATFRAAYELGAQTVAVFRWEERNAVHRREADESYRIGEVGHPVRAYLSVEEVVGAARRAGPTGSIRATGSCRITPSSPRPARRPGSPSSARRRRCSS